MILNDLRRASVIKCQQVGQRPAVTRVAATIIACTIMPPWTLLTKKIERGAVVHVSNSSTWEDGWRRLLAVSVQTTST